MDYQTTVSVDETLEKKEKKVKVFDQKPTAAFIGASWATLLIAMTAYCIGLWNADMELNEKGYYFTILLFGLFSEDIMGHFCIVFEYMRVACPAQARRRRKRHK